MSWRTFWGVFLVWTACSPTMWAEGQIDFAHDVLPILESRCAQCHTDGTYEGGVSFDTREAIIASQVVVPRNPDESELLHRVTSDDPFMRMPPAGEPLSDDQVAVLRRWIDQDLPWESGFSFRSSDYEAALAPRRPVLPEPAPGRPHPLDRIIDAYQAEHGIETPGTIGDAEFLRRVSLDVVGLLPAPKELDAFPADTSPDKRRRLVRKLLADRRAYADHWLTFWNDLLRNDYQGTGYIDGGRKQITGWLYQSLWENKPYDQFVRELLDPTPQSEGFIRGIRWRGNVNASQTPELQFAQTTSQVFLGINIKCASCHDSFIDDWKLDDAYGLAAVTAEGPLEIHRCDKPTGRFAQAAFLFPELGTIDAELPREQRLEQFAALMTHPENGRLARTIVNRIWQRLMGRGIVEPVDAMASEPWSEDLLDYLAVHLADNGYDLKATIELIVTSQAYQSQCTVSPTPEGAEDYVFRGPLPKRMTAEQFIDAVWMITGTAPEKADAPVTLSESEPQMIRASLVNADRLMRALGRPHREQVVTTRPAELDTLQALQLTNGEDLAGLLIRGAKDIRQHHPEWTPQQTARWLFRRALCREPTRDELVAARAVLGDPMTDEGLADLMWIVFMLPEFQMIR